MQSRVARTSFESRPESLTALVAAVVAWAAACWAAEASELNESHIAPSRLDLRLAWAGIRPLPEPVVRLC